MGHNEAYLDDGTPQEQSRRTFMVQATLALGGVIGLGLVIPLVTSLVPPPDASSAEWSPLTEAEFTDLKKATDTPTKVTFNLHRVDGYLPAADEEQFVWAIKTTEDAMKAKRPTLFEGNEKVPYPVVNLGFTIFSPICPHLGCRYAYLEKEQKFACPCHGSQFTTLGEHVAGPALRGLDPLPLRDFQGKAQVTWIEYKVGTPDHIVLRIG